MDNQEPKRPSGDDVLLHIQKRLAYRRNSSEKVDVLFDLLVKAGVINREEFNARLAAREAALLGDDDAAFEAEYGNRPNPMLWRDLRRILRHYRDLKPGADDPGAEPDEGEGGDDGEAPA